MSLVERALKNPGPVVGVGLLVLAFPTLFPSLRPQWAFAVKAGAKLFFEAEADAEGDLIDHLAERAIDELADAIARSKPEERDSEVAGVLSRYEDKARRRSQRLGWSEKDRAARFDRHMSVLRRGIARRGARHTGADGEAWKAAERNLDGRHKPSATEE